MKAISDNAILLHVGVHKTGSTALQHTLAAARSDLAAHGVLYPGRSAAHHAAAWAVTGRSMGFGAEAEAAKPRQWTSLVRHARRHKGRVVISSEFFGRMGSAGISKVVGDLGPDRVHLLMAVRPLSELLPSSWQQYLKSGTTADYETWLHDVLENPKPTITAGFWFRADFAKLVKRWTKAVPPERFTALVLNPRDRGLLFRTTEELLALPAGLLDRHRSTGPSNRSLTVPEAELLRRVNELVMPTMGWSTYAANIRQGAVRTIVENRTPPPDEPRIATPQWAMDLARDRQLADLRALKRSGVDLRGRPRLLRRTPAPAAVVPTDEIPADLAALGLASAAGWRPTAD